jgi:hypothetical protein
MRRILRWFDERLASTIRLAVLRHPSAALERPIGWWYVFGSDVMCSSRIDREAPMTTCPRRTPRKTPSSSRRTRRSAASSAASTGAPARWWSWSHPRGPSSLRLPYPREINWLGIRAASRPRHIFTGCCCAPGRPWDRGGRAAPRAAARHLLAKLVVAGQTSAVRHHATRHVFLPAAMPGYRPAPVPGHRASPSHRCRHPGELRQHYAS